MEFGKMKRNTSNWSNFGMLLRRAGLTASAGLSCWPCSLFPLTLRVQCNVICASSASASAQLSLSCFSFCYI